MSDEEFDQLRLDLEFLGSPVATMNRMEVMFMVAANRYVSWMFKQHLDKHRNLHILVFLSCCCSGMVTC
jgi:hypothetical protein